MKSFKRAISLLLVSVMIIFSLPVDAIAQELNNPRAKEELIAALSEQYGPEAAEAIFDSMVSMGIIDEKGNRLTYKIEMDGEFYTLDQMRDVVNDPDVDLTREVKVDGKTVTLDFISKLIDFEEYLKFVEENFIRNNVEVTDEHLKMLEDLENQLTQEGITLMAVPEPAPVPIVKCKVGTISGNSVNITYTMTEGGDDSSVTFSQECLTGELGGMATTTTSTVALLSSEPEKTVTIKLPDTDDVLWNGNATVSYVQLSNLRGGLFSNEKSNQIVPITKNSTYGFTTYNGANFLKNPVTAKNLDGWQVTKGKWNDGDYGGEIKGTSNDPVVAYQDVMLNADGISLAANGELKVGASGIFWAQPSCTMMAYLKVEFFNSSGSSLGSKEVKYDKYKVTKHNETLSFSGYTVPAGTVKMRLTVKNDDSLAGIHPSMRQFSLTLTDTKAPTVEGIASPKGTFKAGQQVPIVVTFSEPVVLDKTLTLTMKDAMGKTYTVKSQNTGVKGSKVVFMFDIPPQTPITLWPISVSAGAKDISGNSSATYNFPIDSKTGKTTPLATVFAYNELDSITGFVLKHEDGSKLTGTYKPEERKGYLEIHLFQSSSPTIDGSTLSEKQNEWLINHRTVDSEEKFTVGRLYASYNNGTTRTVLYITDEVDKLTGEFDLPEGGTCKMRLYIDYEGSGEFYPVLEDAYSVSFVKGELVPVDAKDMRIIYPESYPSGIDKLLYLGDEELIRLTYSYSGNATFKSPSDFKWVSTDERVATISSTGEITPVGVGKVKFKLVAMNGADDGTRDITIESEEFSVQASLSKPSLSVSKYITTKRACLYRLYGAPMLSTSTSKLSLRLTQSLPWNFMRETIQA